LQHFYLFFLILRLFQ